MDVWERAMEGEKVDWRKFFEKYAVADWPAGLFYKDIITAHPEAKVMISVRDPEGWYESINAMLGNIRNLNLPIPQLKRAKRFLEVYAINGFFEGKVDDKEHMINLFHKHVEGVKAVVPAEKLLVYNVREGWEPLCKFLDIPVPDKEFPRVNQRENFMELVTSLFKH